ncbi:MAG: energy transducer TonB [Calditrichaeota bacterium]|nr:energy transducer TonB [Candidatus Cloacimonadota bacterium]MCA9787055.1 energy transducer TonB [Candidatus Cloacimonadota bacterium]MCB1046009.1 energy transducer TonB [Calditrichota bacterium]
MRVRHALNADLHERYLILCELGLALALAMVCLVFQLSREPASSDSLAHHCGLVDPTWVVPVATPAVERPNPRPARPTFVVSALSDDPELEQTIDYADLGEWQPATLPPPPFEGEEEVVEIFLVERMPVLLGGLESLHRSVIYPDLALRAGIEGRALIGFVVGVDGIPRDLQILQEDPPRFGFGDSAMKALASARFIPGKQRDRDVAVHMQQVVRFTLH